MLYLGWIVVSFLAGFLLSQGLKHRTKRTTLQERFSIVDVFRGRSYREVLAIAGEKPRRAIYFTDGGTQRIWQEDGYSITLAFNRWDVCLGVVEEQGQTG